MQPYFLPYLGYFQLMNAVDKFVVYDNIQFTKKSWIRRNRFLLNGHDAWFTLPLKKDSDYLYVSQRYLSSNFKVDAQRILRRLSNAYRSAPFYNVVMPILGEIFSYTNMNLFQFIYNSILIINTYLEIKVEIVISSSLDFNDELKAQDKVLDICRVCGTDYYLNSIGGVRLYNKADFEEQNITLNFLKPTLSNYEQFNNDFFPSLSIIDVMMFNSPQDINRMLNCYELE